MEVLVKSIAPDKASKNGGKTAKSSEKAKAEKEKAAKKKAEEERKAKIAEEREERRRRREEEAKAEEERKEVEKLAKKEEKVKKRKEDERKKKKKREESSEDSADEKASKKEEERKKKKKREESGEESADEKANKKKKAKTDAKDKAVEKEEEEVKTGDDSEAVTSSDEEEVTKKPPYRIPKKKKGTWDKITAEMKQLLVSAEMTREQVDNMDHSEVCSLVQAIREAKRDEEKSGGKVGETLRPNRSAEIQPKLFEEFLDDGKEALHDARFEPVGPNFEKYTSKVRREVKPIRDIIWEEETGMRDKVAPSTYRSFQIQHRYLK